MSTKILNQAQAEAVYSAMCALNNVGAVCLIDIPSSNRAQDDIGVNAADGEVVVRVGICGDVERYANQSAFAAAYGLQQDGEKAEGTAVYTAGIGWQFQDRHGRCGNFETEAEALAHGRRR